MLHSAVAAVLLAVPAVPLFAQCEPSPQVRRILSNASRVNTEGLSRAEASARRTAILNKGLEQFPNEYFLIAQIQAEAGDEKARINAARAAREKHPDDPVYTLTYARALLGQDTAQAIRLYEDVVKSHPEMARAHAFLAQASTGKFQNPERQKAEIEAFFAACRAPLDASVLNMLGVLGSKEQLAPVAPALRERLEKESDPLLNSVWEVLWRIEFKVRPPAEHDALRKQIAQDLVRLEAHPDTDQLRWLQFLQYGYESAGDLAAAGKMKDRILQEFPKSRASKDIVQEQFSKQHPYPRNGDAAQIEAWRREALKTYEEWHTRWPDDSLLDNLVFSSLVALPDTPAERIAKVGEELVALYHKDPNWSGAVPVEFEVAREFSKRKIGLDKVPGFIDEGYRIALDRYEGFLRSDSMPAETADSFRGTIMMLKVERGRALLDYYEAIKQPGKASAIEAELADLHPTKPYQKSTLFEVQARAAELLGRKLDALLMYRSALELRPRAPQGGKDPLAENIDRLWKELGGTAATRPLFDNKQAAEEANASRWERPPKPLPAFSLSDFEGKNWKLADLAGKAVLINLWATWCGPCRQEHPEFQKLYDKLKGRSDVVVLSFNVDTDLSRVVPYIKEGKYTFPSLAAYEFVRSYYPDSLSIPQNWFIDPAGKLQLIQIGYGGEPNWQETMLAKLEEVLRTKP